MGEKAGIFSMNEGTQQIRVLFFAHIKELTGTRQLDLEIPGGWTVKDLKLEMVRRFPDLNKAMDHLITAVNQNFAPDENLIPAGAEVAFFPPVSGGAGGKTIIKITTFEIKIEEIQREITSQTTGGICSFTGVVRGISPGSNFQITEKLEYEAYTPMAEKKMHEIAAEIRTRWSVVEGIAIIQRIGVVPPGTPVVLVACSAAHRDNGIFEAARYGIDRLKEVVPVWKKETGPDGEEWIEGTYQPTDSN
jgi:molybdopterin synthase catalytic subunit